MGFSPVTAIGSDADPMPDHRPGGPDGPPWWVPLAVSLIVVVVVAVGVGIWVALSGSDDRPAPTAAPGPPVERPQVPESTIPDQAEPAPTVLLVSPEGDDQGDGSPQRPLATIDAAVELVPDGGTIEVAPGTYDGPVRLNRQFDDGIVIRSTERYRALLRDDDTVLACYRCAGVTVEGFDVAHDGDDTERYVVQIQDVTDDGTGGQRVVLRDNIIHDSGNNDLLKINSGAGAIRVEGNLFFNQAGPDSHIDVNGATDVELVGNVFFNDFGAEASSRGTAAFIVIKDSNGNEDGVLGSRRVAVTGNVFLNWQGSRGSAFIAVGEDSVTWHQAVDVLVENNLFLGNSTDLIRSALLAKGVDGLTVRHNTVVGDLPSETYAFRLGLQDGNPPNRRVVVANNIWSDPTGTMGHERGKPDFSDSPTDDTESHQLVGNLFWNGGTDLPDDEDDLLDPRSDAGAVLDDPLLPTAPVVVPRPVDGRFPGGETSIGEVLRSLVLTHGTPAVDTPARDAAWAGQTAATDILGRRRQTPDIGAVELVGSP